MEKGLLTTRQLYLHEKLLTFFVHLKKTKKAVWIPFSEMMMPEGVVMTTNLKGVKVGSGQIHRDGATCC